MISRVHTRKSSTAAQTAASAESPIAHNATALAEELYAERETYGPLIDRLTDFAEHLPADERDLVERFANLSGRVSVILLRAVKR